MFASYRFSILLVIFNIFAANAKADEVSSTNKTAPINPHIAAPPSAKPPTANPPAQKPPGPSPQPEPQAKPQPNPQPTPLNCDTPSDDTMTVYGAAKKWEKSDDPVFYLTPGFGYCEEQYTDQSNVVCVSSGHFPNNSKKSCQEWVQVTNKASGVVSFGRILDQCGNVPNSTFGCTTISTSENRCS